MIETTRTKNNHRNDDKDSAQEMLAYMLLKTVAELGKARNENITKVLLLCKEKDVTVPGINFHYTPRGPWASEVQSFLGLSLITGDIKQLSPATLTETGHKHLEEIESHIPSSVQTQVLECINDSR